MPQVFETWFDRLSVFHLLAGVGTMRASNKMYQVAKQNWPQHLVLRKNRTSGPQPSPSPSQSTANRRQNGRSWLWLGPKRKPYEAHQWSEDCASTTILRLGYSSRASGRRATCHGILDVRELSVELSSSVPGCAWQVEMMDRKQDGKLSSSVGVLVFHYSGECQNATSLETREIHNTVQQQYTQVQQSDYLRQ